MKRATILTLSIAIISVLATTPATAGTRTIELEPMMPEIIKAWGMSQVATRGKVQTFRVRVDADLKDGTGIVVSVQLVNTPELSLWVDVAKAEMQLGTASVGLGNWKDVSPVFPVGNVLGVRVQYRGNTILQGRFPVPGSVE
jgi:hypothetical protein